jgi:hypothetical protein
MTVTLNDAAREAVARWTDPARRPLFKGMLIDKGDVDGAAPGEPGGPCMCAQGDVLFHNGFTPDDLRAMQQSRADEETARLLGISISHAILLRQVNDGEDGCPQDVLTHPEKVLGPNARGILAFWLHIDRMTADQWRAARAAWDARDARDARAAWDARDARDARAAWDARDARAARAAWDARDARDARAARAARAAWAAWDARAAWAAANIAYAALAEIGGARWLPEHERGELVFLPMFGFASVEELLA